jgi:hypothetical protein
MCVVYHPVWCRCIEDFRDPGKIARWTLCQQFAQSDLRILFFLRGQSDLRIDLVAFVHHRIYARNPCILILNTTYCTG